MIREQQSWTPSELIYLFVDGEADDVQKHLLFTALANDAALQGEFSDALRIGAAIKGAGLEGGPPQHVTAALFEKAGFGLPAEKISTVGGAAAAAGGGGFSSRLQRFAVPFFSALIGGIIALFFAPEILRQSGEGTLSPVALHGPTMQSAPTSPQPMNVADAVAAHPQSVEGNRRNMADGTAARSGTGAAPHSALSVRTERSRKEKMEAVATTSEERAHDAIVNGANGEGGTDAVGKNIDPALVPADTASSQMRAVDASAAPMPAIPESEQTAAPAQARETDEQPLALLKSAIADISASEGFQDPRFALQVRGMAQLELFPHRSMSTNEQTIFENIAAAGFYNISRNHSVGIEVGREYHPLYVPTTAGSGSSIAAPVVNGGGSGSGGGIGIILNGAGPGTNGSGGALTGNAANSGGSRNAFPTAANEEKVSEDPKGIPATTGYQLQPHIAWFGLAYQFRAGSIDRLGLIRPFAQAMVGGTEIGPIGKGTLGISWTPDSRVSFNLGVEGTTVLYRNNGDWYSSRKLGLAYSAQVNF